jgi:mono/diheme cytochrome c family protein
MTLRLWSAILIGTVLATAQAGAAEDANPGRTAYLKYCSACHGSEGKGDGIVATVLRPKPTDLTQLSKAHGGQFPRAQVERSIDGRQPIAAHGDGETPVWGEIFAKEKGSTITAHAEVRGQVQLITEYVQSIQAQ